MTIVEPSINLANGFIAKAEDSLEEMRNAKKKEWKITTAYYSMYQSVYALFMRVGIKCEIHACTLELLKVLFPSYFSGENFDLLDRAFNARKDATYYTNRDVKDEVVEEILGEAPKMFVKCKTILLRFSENNVLEIRRKIEELEGQ